MKAGFLVNAKIARIYQNGVEISFLGGMKGTVFVDHIGKDLTKLKVGEKVKARCISHDVSTKSTTMSLLQHVVDLVTKDMCLIGTSFEKVKVTKIVYGGSY
jgi:ribosomal protein S1